MPDPRGLPAFYDDLDETLAEAWRLVGRGVADRHSRFHTPTIATTGMDGRPRLRTVVLRGCDPVLTQLRFHTDARADKVAELIRDPRIALHAYDPSAKVQIRIEGIATVHGDDEVSGRAWSGSLAMSRACYAMSPAPGQRMDAPDAYVVPSELEENAGARAHFRAVIITATRLEWLYLTRQGHRRALFDFCDGTAGWRYRRMAPRRPE